MGLKIKILEPGEDLEDAFYIREKVFIEEKGISKEVERDKYDKLATHVLVYKDNLAIGTGRLLYKNGEYSIGRVAVLKNFRKLGAGYLATMELIKKAKICGAKKIKIHAMKDVEDFYKKIGFKKIGDTFIEVGIEHITMELTDLNIV